MLPAATTLSVREALCLGHGYMFCLHTEQVHGPEEGVTL